MRYLLFREDATYQDEHGQPQSFGQHLQYLRTWGGTPDCWDTADTLAAARKSARSANCTITIIDEHLDYRPVGKVENFDPAVADAPT